MDHIVRTINYWLLLRLRSRITASQSAKIRHLKRHNSRCFLPLRQRHLQSREAIVPDKEPIETLQTDCRFLQSKDLSITFLRNWKDPCSCRYWRNRAEGLLRRNRNRVWIEKIPLLAIGRKRYRLLETQKQLGSQMGRKRVHSTQIGKHLRHLYARVQRCIQLKCLIFLFLLMKIKSISSPYKHS